ncbi:MAG: hypothetical protein ACTHKV_14955 [Flavipsychrobacter sp.]
MDSIREWLNGHRNYNQGAALYECYGDDPKLKQMFAQGESEYRKERLVKELRALLGAAKPVSIPVKPSAPPETVHIKTGTSPETKVPEAKDPYYKDWIQPYREMQRLRGQLRFDMTDEQRGTLAFKILTLEQVCNYWWRKRDYLLEHGKELNEPMPGAKPDDVVADPAKYQTRLTTVRTFISKARKKLQQNPDDMKAKENLEKYTAEKERMEGLIAGK